MHATAFAQGDDGPGPTAPIPSAGIAAAASGPETTAAAAADPDERWPPLVPQQQPPAGAGGQAADTDVMRALLRQGEAIEELRRENQQLKRTLCVLQPDADFCPRP